MTNRTGTVTRETMAEPRKELTSAVEDYLKADLRARCRRQARDDLGARRADARQRPVGDGDDEAARRARARRAGAVPRCRADRARAGSARSRCCGTTGCSSATSPTRSGCRSTRCTPRPTGSSTCSRRSSRRGSTRRSAIRPHDPHGDPIPDSDAAHRRRAPRARVADLDPGDTAVVARVPDGDPELLRYLAEIALVPGQALELTRSAPVRRAR